MTAPALTQTRSDPDWTSLKTVAPALVLGLGLLGLLFNEEVRAAVRTWDNSTAYNHCYLVLPIVAYLLWDRKSILMQSAVVPDWRFALLGAPIIAVWLVAERLGIMEGRQLMVICLVQALALGVLGWRMWYSLSGPLLYLFFLVPFGDFLTPSLQDFTTMFSLKGLEVIGIPYFSDGYTIEIAEGVFYVAEACAGLRFLIASIAFGVLYALMMYRSPKRRLIYILISIVTPVIANGFRALGIVVLGHYLGSAEAAGADHLIYGWVFFSFVILLLVVLGLPFREDGMQAAAPLPFPATLPPDARQGALLAAALTLVLATIGPAIAGTLDYRAKSSALQASLQPDPGCAVIPNADTAAGQDGSPTMTGQVFHCNGLNVLVHVQAFSPRSGPGVVLGQQRRLLRGSAGGETMSTWLPFPAEGARVWRLLEAEDTARAATSNLWMNGAVVQPGLRMRMQLAWNSVMGSTSVPVLVVVASINEGPQQNPGGRRGARQAIEAFLAHETTLVSQIVALGSGAGY